jgi:hypothetical protein
MAAFLTGGKFQRGAPLITALTRIVLAFLLCHPDKFLWISQRLLFAHDILYP